MWVTQSHNSSSKVDTKPIQTMKSRYKESCVSVEALRFCLCGAFAENHAGEPFHRTRQDADEHQDNRNTKLKKIVLSKTLYVDIIIT
jgi:hypothetical protein